MAIRVMLVDAQPLYVDGMIASLSRDSRFSVIDKQHDHGQALKRLPELAPEVLVVDVDAPAIKGLLCGPPLVGRMKNSGAAKVIVLTAQRDENAMRHCFEHGASAYLLKNISGTELAETIIAVSRGKMIIASDFDARALTRPSPQTPHPKDWLTARERQVLALVASGYKSREIARRLGIGARTVETHRLRLLRKFKARNAAELVRSATRQGIVKS